MPQPAELERQERQLSRLSTLMDVMFALMLFRVLQAIPPPSQEEDWIWTAGALMEFLAEAGDGILMALIGVILLVIYWLQNNKLLGNLTRTNGVHVSFCIAQVVFLIFYAYGMAIAEDFDSPATRALQSLSLAGVGFAGFLGFRYASRNRRLLSETMTNKEADELKIAVLPEPVVALITADLRFNQLETTRAMLDTVASPIYWLADIPTRIGDWGDEHIQSRARLLENNERLRRENLVLQGRSHQMASLQAENIRLRALLNSSALLRDDVLVAELIGVSPDPVRHQLVLNKGESDGVFMGQPLIEIRPDW